MLELTGKTDDAMLIYVDESRGDLFFDGVVKLKGGKSHAPFIVNYWGIEMTEDENTLPRDMHSSYNHLKHEILFKSLRTDID